MTGNSMLSDLSQRVKRFGKAPKSVPGTYMSAAGIQTEVHPTTLARLAVHEAVYRKQVHVYRQDLQNTVYRIRRDQRQMRKVEKEYKRIQKHYKLSKNRYINQFAVAPNPSVFTHKATAQVEDNKTQVQKLLKEVKILLPGFDQLKDNFKESEMLQKHDEKSEKDTSEEISLAVNSDDETEESNEQIKYTKTVSPMDNTQVQDNNINVEATSDLASLNHDQDLKKGFMNSNNKTEINSGHSFVQRKFITHGNKSETSSFMELVRLKNKAGLTKNMEVVDRIIKNSKNKKFAYFTKVQMQPKNKDDLKHSHLSQKSLPNFTTDGNKYLLTSGSDIKGKGKIAIKERNVQKNIVLSPIIESSFLHKDVKGFTKSAHLAGNQEHLLTERETRKFISKSSPSISPLNHEKPKSGIDSKMTKPANHIQTRRDSTDGAVNVTQAPTFEERRGVKKILSLFLEKTDTKPITHLSIPAKQIDKFLQNEKLKTENYKSDVTWQQSLASIKDVHYIQNKNDYEDFAKQVIQKSQEKFTALE